MQIIVQEKFENDLQEMILKKSTWGHSESKKTTHIIIGDLNFIKSHVPLTDIEIFYVLVQASDEILDLNFDIGQQKSPFQILQQSELAKINEVILQIESQVDRQFKIQQIKTQIQKKRKELEQLNEKLNLESEKQILSLEQSHREETQKNFSEKSLLHFLDFIQSESIHEEFLNLLIKFLWKDLKKIGRLYQIGFSFKTFSEKSNIYTYNGLEEHRSVFSVDFSQPNEALTHQMADAWGRPMGRILTWSLPEFSRVGYFFVEIIDQQISIALIESYLKERLVIMSLYLDRWMIAKEYEVLVDRWNRTFKSFSGQVHVIDEDYNIYQSNYSDRKNFSKEQKCYEALVGRKDPCPDCPLKQTKQTDFMLKPGLRVKTYFSEFKYNSKKYFFIIYEDITQVHLLKSQVIHSEKMSALGRLGNHLAHELNNPLTGIKSYVQTLIEDPQSAISASIKADLNEILKATLRSQHIIKNFINFSQKSEQKLEKIIFSEVLQNTLTLLKSVLRPHRLFVDIKPTAIMGHSQDLQQVLFNLIKNSCQAMTSAGTIKIYEDEQNQKVYFHIEDSGPGFADEIEKNLFEPFMTTKNNGEGTGLGLYLSKKLMKNMNADIQIKSIIQQNKKVGAKISIIFDKV